MGADKIVPSKKFDEIFSDEKKLLAERGWSEEKIVGLALSGGGIRSASFCLGVIRSLNEAKKINCFDYISTVSGGGYAGAALTWLIDKKFTNNNQKGDINFLNEFLDRLRFNGNYLDPGKRLTTITLIGVVLRTMVVNLLVYGGLMVVALFLYEWFRCLSGINIALWISGAATILAVIFASAYAISTSVTTLDRIVSLRYRLRIYSQQLSGWLVGVIIVTAFIAALPELRLLLNKLGDGAETGVGLTAFLLGAWGAFSKLTDALSKIEDAPSPIKKMLPSLAAVALVGGTVIVTYDIAVRLVDCQNAAYAYGIVTLIFFVAFLVGAYTDLNLISLHRMYRDRLMEAFLPNKENLGKDDWAPATEANGAALASFAQRPLHLLNANIILIDSTGGKGRTRGGDNYILSPLYAGSLTTGWYSTQDIMGSKDKSGNTRDAITLATAVAISGAAVNGRVGSNAQPGLLRNDAVSFLLSFFGLQLGCWVKNPSYKKLVTPNYFRPGFKALLGGGFRRGAKFHMLSDGGHFDNTGIYELIRRETDVIVAVDGSADGSFHFDDLAAIIEKVRADFCADISFPGGPSGALADLKPSKLSSRFPDITVAERGWTEGKIIYRDKNDNSIKKSGRLLYVKSTLVNDLPPDVYGYAAANQEFPHQSTADQFFDEFQLQSYVELGAAIGAQVAPHIPCYSHH